MVAAGSPEIDALPPDVIMYVISCRYMSTCSFLLSTQESTADDEAIDAQSESVDDRPSGKRVYI